MNLRKKFVFGLFLAVVLVSFIMLPSLKGISRVGEDPIQFGEDDSMRSLQFKIQQMREEIAKNGDTFEVGLNPAMQYPLEQICSFNPDMKPADDYLYEQNENMLSSEMALPTSYTGYYTSIKNQGNCGSCWAFSTIAGAETDALLGGTTYNFSEQYVLDCNTSGYSCSGGFFAFNMCYGSYGCRLESCYPYTAVKGTCKSTCASVYKITGWSYVGSSSSVPTTTAIKTAIYNYGAVSAAIYANSYIQAYTGGCYSRNNSGSPNHAIQLVGWNDTTPCTGGAWYLKNSWGTSWGASGLMWIKYGYQKVGYAACYAY
jgi:C1A family cysteine protease